MTDYITDREIERLALGELDEEAANELMRRLEERDELDRLEAIIADDEAFLEAHPPALLAQQVRDEVRRRTREHTTQEPRMIDPSRTRFAAGIVAGFAVAAVLFAFAYVQSADPEKPTDRVASMTNNTATNQAAPAPAPAPIPVPEPEQEVEKPRGQLLMDRGTEFLMPSTFYMSKGEIIEAPARGIMRITLSVTKVIEASIHGEKSLYIEAKEAGQSMLSLTQKNDGQENTRSALIVVGEPLTDEVVGRLVDGDYGVDNPSLLECADHSDAVVTLRIVAQHGSTFVGHAHAEGADLSPELKRCIDDVVGRWRVGMLVEPAEIRSKTDYSPGPAKLSVGTVRFNFGTSAMCAPNDDDC